MARDRNTPDRYSTAPWAADAGRFGRYAAWAVLAVAH